MSYAVLVSELRAAAGSYEAVGNDLGTTPVVIDHIDPASLGHIELAAWLQAVAEQCTNAHGALHDGMGILADSLRVAATQYETTDEQQGDRYRVPLPWDPGATPFGPAGNVPYGS